jgi:formylglycine-generating enzyme required for sulfatase activity
MVPLKANEINEEWIRKNLPKDITKKSADAICKAMNRDVEQRTRKTSVFFGETIVIKKPPIPPEPDTPYKKIAIGLAVLLVMGIIFFIRKGGKKEDPIVIASDSIDSSIASDSIDSSMTNDSLTTTPPQNQPKEIEKFTVKGVSFNMVRVEGGTFQMGATPEQGSDVKDDERPVHSVTLGSYLIGETEVTQELWEVVMGTTVSQQRDKEDKDKPLCGVGRDYPMYYVSWNECIEFIDRLNSLTGQQFRLPTEAEWEFAARGGNKSGHYKYSGSDEIDNVAWYDNNSKDKTYPVRIKQPNELGIYDMSGNVMEWCEDWDGEEYYNSSPSYNPKGPSEGSYRINRGGSWFDSAWDCRVSSRGSFTPDVCDDDLGFRLALSSLTIDR